MTLATHYRAWLDLVRDVLATYPSADTRAMMYANAERVYRLDDTAVPPDTSREESV